MDWFSKTYDETVSYWSQPDALEDAADAIGFGLDVVQESAAETYDEAAEAIETAAMTGTTYIVKAALTAGAIFIAFTALTAYAKAKATKAGNGR